MEIISNITKKLNEGRFGRSSYEQQHQYFSKMLLPKLAAASKGYDPENPAISCEDVLLNRP